ncbi:MAG: MBOAT family O-acyltransferase [Betaproteobacteria bacterium]
MLFNSGQFLFFFAATYALYLALGWRRQNYLLLAASYLFYGAWDYRFLGLLWFATIMDYVVGIRVEREHARGRPEAAWRWLLLSLAGNLGMLGFFKYFNFFADSMQALAATAGLELSRVTLDIVLPVGLSFYTFQTMSYTIDVYRKRQRAVTVFPDFALFVAFFPQLLAGPIERAGTLIAQIQAPRTIGAEDLRQGGWLILWGLFKKVYIADNLAPYVTWAFPLHGADLSWDVYVAIFAFSIQIYCDFSGYSDMARGLARLMGFSLVRNFNLPFFSSNPSQFWQRWHISLSNWFRDYVYNPLLYGYIRHWFTPRWHSLAVIPTMVLVGLWHGAAWKFVAFGGAWGAVLFGHRALYPALDKLSDRASPTTRTAMQWGGVFLTFHIWLLLLILFIAVDLAHGWQLWGKLLSGTGSSVNTARDALTILFYTVPLIVIEVIQYRRGTEDVLHGCPYLVRFAVYVLLVVLLLINGAEHQQEFIYFHF